MRQGSCADRASPFQTRMAFLADEVVGVLQAVFAWNGMIWRGTFFEDLWRSIWMSSDLWYRGSLAGSDEIRNGSRAIA